MSGQSPATPEPEDDLVQMTKEQFDLLVSQISASYSTPSLPTNTSPSTRTKEQLDQLVSQISASYSTPSPQPSTSASLPGPSATPTFTKSGLEKQFAFNSSVLSVLTPALELLKEDETKDYLRRAITLLTQRNELLTVADTDPEVFEFFDKQSKADAMQLTNPILAAFIREKKKKEEKKPIASRGSERVTGHTRNSPFGLEGRHGPPPLFLTRRPSMVKHAGSRLAVTPQGFKGARGTCALTAGAMDITPVNVERSANEKLKRCWKAVASEIAEKEQAGTALKYRWPLASQEKEEIKADHPLIHQQGTPSREGSKECSRMPAWNTGALHRTPLEEEQPLQQSEQGVTLPMLCASDDGGLPRPSLATLIPALFDWCLYYIRSYKISLCLVLLDIVLFLFFVGIA
ncbi:unnamed protein product [Cylicocyclus nassatus]|uniref:Uncharacterized protein n=1 Tax=Cylicocyclus nassatus TaxID=53992 RepID=A0AA36H0K9_CYLNA|nr:unnamed protein product [Cylicocyclus nassatus]